MESLLLVITYETGPIEKKMLGCQKSKAEPEQRNFSLNHILYAMEVRESESVLPHFQRKI